MASILRASTFATRCLSWLHRHEFIRFVLVGGINTLVTYLIYVSLLFVLTYPVAYSVTFVLGVFISYFLNARLVFRQRLSLVVALQYPVVYLAQYLLGLTLLYVLVEWGRMSEYVAPVLIVFVSVPITYILSRRVIGRGSLGENRDKGGQRG